MLRPVLTSAPATTPISVTEAKAHCDITYSGDDSLIGALVDAATAHVDGWAGILGRCLVTQSWRVSFADWPASGCIRLPFPDVSAITSVKYYDADNVEQTVSSSLYELLEDERGSFIRFLDDFTSPSVYDDRSDGVRVVFVAGYGNAAAVPAAIRVALLMIVAHLYENREAVTMGQAIELPMGAAALLAPYRRIGV